MGPLMTHDSAIYLASALLGALFGGLISLGVTARNARRDRRVRYGEAMLATLGQAHRKVGGASGTRGEPGPDPGRLVSGRLLFPDEARAIWVQAELASTLEWRTSARRAIEGWALYFYEALSRGAGRELQLEWLEQQLEIGTYLVIAWTAGHAAGRDFRRSGHEVEALFGPHPSESETPDYGQFPT